MRWPCCAGHGCLPTEYVFWNQGYFDAHLEYPIESPSSAFALDFRVAPGLRDRLKLDLRFLTADGRERAYELSTGQGPVVLDPRWYQAACDLRGVRIRARPARAGPPAVPASA